MGQLLDNVSVRPLLSKMGPARYICYLLAVVLLIASAFCLLWVLSSSSMAFTECKGQYELFADNDRCRQPPLAALLALANLVGAIALAWIGRIRFKSRIARVGP